MLKKVLNINLLLGCSLGKCHVSGIYSNLCRQTKGLDLKLEGGADNLKQKLDEQMRKSLKDHKMNLFTSAAAFNFMLI